MRCDARRIARLPPSGRTMINADRFPIVTRDRQTREKNPARRLGIETGIVLEPMPDMGFGSPDKRRNFGYPPTVDLQRPEIMSAIAVDDSGADPAAFLIAQTPKRTFEPRLAMGCAANAARDPSLGQSGKAAFRESVCQFGDISGV